MSQTADLKNNIHALVDQSSDNELLEIVYHLLHSKDDRKEGDVLKKLNDEQKKELYQAYEDSFDETKLIGLEDFKDKHKKWLEE